MMIFSRRQKEDEYPNLPGTLNADPYYDDPNSSRLPNTAVATPYVGWKGRLSQLPINRWTILIVLVLIRVLIMLSGLNDDIGTAKEKALSACTKVEDVGSAMASMPHYLSLGVNDLAAGGITNVVHGLVSTIGLILSAVREIILFVINLVVGTYVCLISALIHGGLDAAKSAIEGVTDLLNDAIDGVANGIEDNVESFESLMNKFTNKINELTNGVGGIIDGVFGDDTIDIPEIPKLDLSDEMNKLKNLDVDASKVTKGLDDLNSNIPDFNDIRDMTRKAISIPFNLVQEQIDDSWGNYSFSREIFPLAQKQALTFCSDNSKIQEFFQSLYKLSANSKKGFIIGLVIAAVVAMIVMYPLERHRWNRQRHLSRLIHNHGFNPLDVVYITSRPMSSRVGIWLSDKLASGRRAVLVRWAWAYGTTLPALFLLSLALAGYFACLCQYFVLVGIEQKVPELAEQVGDFAGDIVNGLQDVSVRWADDANAVIVDFNKDFNDDMFGHVTDATTAVNDTLNTFVDAMNDGLDSVFKDTPLYKPVQDIIFCLVTVKVEGIQNGITWVHDHAHVDFPRFQNDTFSLGAAESIKEDSDLQTFLASPGSATTDEITDAAQKIADRLKKNIVIELLISTGILLTYIIVVLAGVVAAAMRMVPSKKEDGAGFVTATDKIASHRRGTPGSPSGSIHFTKGDASNMSSHPFYEKANTERQYDRMHDVKL